MAGFFETLKSIGKLDNMPASYIYTDPLVATYSSLTGSLKCNEYYFESTYDEKINGISNSIMHCSIDTNNSIYMPSSKPNRAYGYVNKKGTSASRATVSVTVGKYKCYCKDISHMGKCSDAIITSVCSVSGTYYILGYGTFNFNGVDINGKDIGTSSTIAAFCIPIDQIATVTSISEIYRSGTKNYGNGIIKINGSKPQNFNLSGLTDPIYKIQLSEWFKYNANSTNAPTKYNQVTNVHYGKPTGEKYSMFYTGNDGSTQSIKSGLDRWELRLKNVYMLHKFESFQHMPTSDGFTLFTTGPVTSKYDSKEDMTIITADSGSTQNDGFNIYYTYAETNENGIVTNLWCGFKAKLYIHILKYNSNNKKMEYTVSGSGINTVLWIDALNSGTNLNWSFFDLESGKKLDTDELVDDDGNRMPTDNNNTDNGGGTGGGGTQTSETQTAPSMPETASPYASGTGENVDPAAVIETYYNQTSYSTIDDYSLSSLKSVVGMPFQFLPNTDSRINGSGYGKRYLENIVYDAPFATIIPGYAIAGSEENRGIIQSAIDAIAKIYVGLKNIGDHGAGDTLTSYLTEFMTSADTQPFFTFMPDNKAYIEYVNTLCFMFIHFLGIEDLEMPDGRGKYMNYDMLEDYGATDANSAIGLNEEGLSFTKLFGNYAGLYIFYEPESQITSTFSNITKQADIENKIMSYSSYFKEMDYFNSTAAEQEDSGSVRSAFSAIAGNGGLKRLFGAIGEGIDVVLGGNNMHLPEMYDHSETGDNKKYSMTITLMSPYADPESVFLYQLRPLAKLLAIALPKQAGPNSYTSPFMIQAFSKGEFNCQLGIVDSLTISRSGDDKNSRSVYGIPTELKITLTIEDLYTETVLTNMFYGYNASLRSALSGGYARMVNNIGLSDYLASFCGYNLNTSEIERKFNMLIAALKRNFDYRIDFEAIGEGDFGRAFPIINRKFADAVSKEAARISSLIRAY